MKISLSFLSRLWSNWITLIGAILTTCSALAIIALMATEFVVPGKNPYLTTALFVSLPVLFVLGLLMIPTGLFIDRRARAKAGAAFEPNPILESFRAAMNQRTARNLFFFFAIATVINVIIFAAGGQAAVHRMDSAEFCGATCHVMQPEWTAYAGSKHARVACVECHIGPGAAWELKAKLNGIKQVWGVITNRYDRPIPTPVTNLRPSRDTCEHCHWPEKFTGDKLVVLPHFTDDKTNTPAYNMMLVRVGGRNESTHKYEGIHWHVSDTAEVRYEELDSTRTKVGKITVLDHGKVVAEYLPPERDRSLPVVGERTMDCVDCHNRPTHVFDESPSAAVDRAMTEGELDSKVPWLVKTSRDLLASKDVPVSNMEPWFRAALEQTYKISYPDVQVTPESLDQTAKTLAAAYQRNIFPQMNVGWGTYKSHIGHKHEGDKGDEIGCFRCHDGEHVKVSSTGTKETLSNNCEKCHDTLVAGEDPATLEPELKQFCKR